MDRRRSVSRDGVHHQAGHASHAPGNGDRGYGAPQDAAGAAEPEYVVEGAAEGGDEDAAGHAADACAVELRAAEELEPADYGGAAGADWDAAVGGVGCGGEALPDDAD